MNKVPNGWVSTTLEEVANIVAGNPAPQGEEFFRNGSFPFVRVQDMGRLGDQMYLVETKDKVNDKAASNLTLFPKGSVLFTKSGASTLNNQRAVLGQESYVVSHIGVALPYGGVSNKWIYYGLKQVDFGTLAHASVMPSLPLSKIKAIPMLLPPTNEQDRIIEKLEELFTDLDIGVAELKAAQTKLGQYRQSLLKSAVDGSLTEAWRKDNGGKISETGEQLLQRILKERRKRWEEQKHTEFKAKGQKPPKDWKKKYPEPVQPDTSDLPDLPDGWVWASLDMLGDIASGVTKGTKRKTVIETKEVPYLRVANVQRGYLDLSEIKTIEATENDIEKYTLEPGDILFNEGGDLDKLGRGWVWYGEVESCIHQNHVFRMRPFSLELVSELISHHGNTFGQRWFQSAGKQTTNLASINSTILKSFPVPVAPVAEQIAALEMLNEELSNIDTQSEAVAQALNKLEVQRKNILKSAFAGELVSQDPDDESASLLLERIHKEREEEARQATKTRRPRQRKAMVKQEMSEMIKKLEDVLSAAGDWLPAQEAFQRCGIGNGAETDQIEVLYAELRELDKSGRLKVEAVTNSQGIKQYDRIKLAAEG